MKRTLLHAVYLYKTLTCRNDDLIFTIQGEVVGFDVLGEDQMNKILGTPADDKDTDKERSYENKGQDDSAVEEKEAPESASSMELSPMPKILDHVWHPKIGYWAPNKDDEIEGAPKSSEFTG